MHVLDFIFITFILYKIILFAAEHVVSPYSAVTKLIGLDAVLWYKYFYYENTHII